MSHTSYPPCTAPLTPPTSKVELKSGHNGELFSPFKQRVVCGDDPRLSRGKPTPDVFLLAAREGLGVPSITETVRLPGPEHDGSLLGGEKHILVFEDAKVSEMLQAMCEVR